MKRGHYDSQRVAAILKRREERARKAAIADLREVLSTPPGRRVLVRLVEQLRGNGRPLWTPGAELHARAALHDAGDDLDRQCRTHARELWRQAVLEAEEAEAAETAVREQIHGQQQAQPDDKEQDDE